VCATLKAHSCLVERERRAAERERRATLSFEPPMPLSPPLLLAPSTRPLASAASSRLDCCLPCRAGQARKQLPCALPPLPSDAFACSDAAAAGKSEQVMKRRTSGGCDRQVEICSKKKAKQKSKGI
jgi:hypothetical protein